MKKNIVLRVFFVLILAGQLFSTQVLADDDSDNCLYPSAADRFGITVDSNDPLTNYNISLLGAGRYQNWKADQNPVYPNSIRYTFVVRLRDSGLRPNAERMSIIAALNPGGVWLIGNEPDVMWQDNVSPETYIRGYHTAYHAIKAGDPTARVAIGSIVQASPLRLMWLQRVWDLYRATYGSDMPVDVWNLHAYVANEMHQGWGFEIPKGIDNAVGYSDVLGTHWTQRSDAAASGGTVHESKIAGARTYWAFHGDWVTVHLRTGPDEGVTRLFLDQTDEVRAEIDLYSPTPGSVSRTLRNIPPPGGVLGDRHQLRVQVMGWKNDASSDITVRVDAMEAASTGGVRFEDNSPDRATIINSTNDHDNLAIIASHLRGMRQWMAEHGQRNKPLIISEFGILMTEDVGYTEQRVSAFMRNAFDLLLNGLNDANTGYPADNNRLVQEWYWYILANETSNGRPLHTGLFNEITRQIKPLGREFGAYVLPLRTNYTDLMLSDLALNADWPLFAGQPARFSATSILQNLGNVASSGFDVALSWGNGTAIHTQSIASLPKRDLPGYRQTLSHTWLNVVPAGGTALRWVVDSRSQVSEPCQPNNETSLTLTPPAGTDLALSNLRSNPPILPVLPPGTTRTVTLEVDLRNLGSVGTAATSLQVKFWRGDPNAGGQLLGSKTITPAQATLPVTVSLPWSNIPGGYYRIFARVEPVAEESMVTNNTTSIGLTVPDSSISLPIIQRFIGY